MSNARAQAAVIGAATRIDGLVDASTDLVLAGTIVGDVRANALLHVLAGGTLTGDVVAATVVVDGVLRGTVTATGLVHVTATGQLFGDVPLGNLRLDEGGRLVGSVGASAPSSGAPAAGSTGAAPPIPDTAQDITRDGDDHALAPISDEPPRVAVVDATGDVDTPDVDTPDADALDADALHADAPDADAPDATDGSDGSDESDTSPTVPLPAQGPRSPAGAFGKRRR